MFTRIGRAVSRHPVSVVVGWALLIIVSATLVLHGWGAGGLFERLASGDVATPDSESGVVASMTTSDDSVGERISIVVQGVDVAGDYAGAAAAVGAAREKLSGLDGVASVADAFVLPDPASQQARAMLSSGGDGYVEVVTLDAGLSDKEIDENGRESCRERVIGIV